jgi:hypothetical protein
VQVSKTSLPLDRTLHEIDLLPRSSRRLPNSAVGFANLVNPNNAFMLSSPSTGFTENLRPVLSQTK